MHTRGVTLIELLIVIGGIAIIVTLSMPLSTQFFQRQVLDEVALNVASYIDYAQASALSGKGDTSHGVHVTPAQLTLFQGDQYASRNQDEDVDYVFPAGIAASGTNEVLFERGTGSSTSIEILLVSGKHTQRIISNAAGAHVQ